MSFSVQTQSNELLTLDPSPVSLVTTLRHQALLPDDERQRAALRRAHYELDLPADERQRAVLDRLRAWLALDREEALCLARSFEAACDDLTAEDRADLMDSQRDAILNGLTFHEYERLAGLLPSLGGWRLPWRRSVEPLASPYALIAAAMCGAAA